MITDDRRHECHSHVDLTSSHCMTLVCELLFVFLSSFFSLSAMFTWPFLSPPLAIPDIHCFSFSLSLPLSISLFVFSVPSLFLCLSVSLFLSAWISQSSFFFNLVNKQTHFHPLIPLSLLLFLVCPRFCLSRCDSRARHADIWNFSLLDLNCNSLQCQHLRFQESFGYSRIAMPVFHSWASARLLRFLTPIKTCGRIRIRKHWSDLLGKVMTCMWVWTTFFLYQLPWKRLCAPEVWSPTHHSATKRNLHKFWQQSINTCLFFLFCMQMSLFETISGGKCCRNSALALNERNQATSGTSVQKEEKIKTCAYLFCGDIRSHEVCKIQNANREIHLTKLFHCVVFQNVCGVTQDLIANVTFVSRKLSI